MTPHDELMALAGRWDRWALDALAHSDEDCGRLLESCAADLRALLDSDAFRAMARDAERWRLWRDDAFIDRVDLAALPDEQMEAAVDDAIKAAIDAAASGAGEVSP